MRLLTSLMIVVFGVLATAANAVTWQWSFETSAGTEAGKFKTNGTDADLTAGFRFVIDTSTIQVTASAVENSLIGASFGNTVHPGIGFDWDGSVPTAFFRRLDSGSPAMNGLNFYGSAGTPAQDYRYSFQTSGAFVQTSVDGTVTNWHGQLTLSALQSVPLPAGVVLLATGLAGFGALRRRAGKLR